MTDGVVGVSDAREREAGRSKDRVKKWTTQIGSAVEAENFGSVDEEGEAVSGLWDDLDEGRFFPWQNLGLCEGGGGEGAENGEAEEGEPHGGAGCKKCTNCFRDGCRFGFALTLRVATASEIVSCT